MSRLNPPPVGRTLCVGLGLFLALFTAWEVYARSGPRSDMMRTAAVAAAWRVETAPPPGKRRVMIMGSSRSLCGINPDQLQALLGDGWHVVLAGFHAGHGTRQLKEAEDLLLPGDVVVVDVLPETDFRIATLPGTEEYFRARARARDPLQSIEVFHERHVRPLLTFKRSGAAPLNEAHVQLRRSLGLAPKGGLTWQVHESGWLELVGPVPERQHGDDRELPSGAPVERQAAWLAAIDDLALLEQRAARRSIQIVYLRMPSEGAYGHFERHAYPRSLFWDELARRFSRRCWHFEDFAETRDLKTIDESHLYHEQVEAYTRWLAGQLKATVLRE